MSSSPINIDLVWSRVKQLLELVMAGDERGARKLLDPRGKAQPLLDLYGIIALDITLKTLLDRTDVALTKGVATHGGKFLYLQFSWLPNNHTEQTSSTPITFTIEETVTVRMRQYRNVWRIHDVNPAPLDQWLTSAFARGMLAELRADNNDELPAIPLVLPLSLLAGQINLPLQAKAMKDEVERQVLPTMQSNGYGAYGLIGARRLWRDFKKQSKIVVSEPIVWSAAIELLMSEQALIELDQPMLAAEYGVDLADIIGRTQQIRAAVNLQDVDVRYTSMETVQIKLKEDDNKE